MMRREWFLGKRVMHKKDVGFILPFQLSGILFTWIYHFVIDFFRSGRALIESIWLKCICDFCWARLSLYSFVDAENLTKESYDRLAVDAEFLDEINLFWDQISVFDAAYCFKIQFLIFFLYSTQEIGFPLEVIVLKHSLERKSRFMMHILIVDANLCSWCKINLFPTQNAIFFK